MIINISNWDKYNPRKDVKEPTWFRVNIDIVHSPKLFGFTAAQKWIWVSFLSRAAHKKKGFFDLEMDYLASICNATPKLIRETIELLKSREMITITDSSRARTDTIAHELSCTTTYTTESTEQNTSSCPFPYEGVHNLWNRIADDNFLPQITMVGKAWRDRREKLKQWTKDYPNYSDWEKIFSVAAEKGFTKQDGKVFKPNWDYVFRNNNLVKFHEEASLGDTTNEQIEVAKQKLMED